MRKLHLLANLFMSSQLFRLVELFNKFGKTKVPVLTYHRVLDATQDYPFDLELISASVSGFDQQMSYLKRNYSPISMQQYVDYYVHGKDLPPKPVLITFDDGFADNYENAFQILKRLNIPATIFITTDFIESKEPIWYERLAYFCKKSSAKEIQVPQLDFRFTPSGDLSDGQNFYSSLIESLKLVSNFERISIIKHLYDQYGDPWLEASDEDRNLCAGLTWAQVKEMRDGGIDFGSHSVSHPILSMLESNELEYELAESKKIIEEKLGEEIFTIAFPVGQEESISQDVIDNVNACQYQLGFSFIDGVSDVDNEKRFQINRLHVEADEPLNLLKAKLCLPKLFCE